MYYKNRSSYPQAQGPYGGIKRAPLSSGYRNSMYGTTVNMGTGSFFSNPWMIAIGVLIVLLLAVWMFMSRKRY